MSNVGPTPQRLVEAHLVRLENPAQERRAKENHWTLYYFDGKDFQPLLPDMFGLTLYANILWRQPRHAPEPNPNPKPAPPKPPVPVPVPTPTPPIPPAPTPPTPTPPAPPAPPNPTPVVDTVTFFSQGGSAVDPISGDNGSVVILPTPTYDGFTFDGWFTEATDGVSVVGAYTLIGNSTLYAQWTPVEIPPTPPVPTPGGNPSGLTPPPVPEGYTRILFDDFDETEINSAFWTVYHGVNAEGAVWHPTHVVVENSVVSFNGYQDPNALGSDITVEALAKVLNWAEGGLQSVSTFPLGAIITIAMRVDDYPGLTEICQSMGRPNWPPEFDWEEGGDIFAHWAKNDENKFLGSHNVDRTQWHENQSQITATELTSSVDGVVKASFPPPSQAGDLYGFISEPLALSLQWQTNDPIGEGIPEVPPNDPSVTAENPKQMQLDWVCIDIPS